MNTKLLNLLNKIAEAGYEAYLVGGYPRDLYLKKTTTDYDVTTNATPENLKKIFSVIDDKDSKFGKVTVRTEDITVEITTYRIETEYEEHRKPIVTFTQDLSVDLNRRDFIMNTLCIDKDGNFVDLLGARKDIDNRIIRVVGDAKKKIAEDALRILRAIRFATVLNFTLDEQLKEAISLYKKNLKELSYFRKQEELNKIFASPNIEYGIKLLKDLEEELEISGLSQLNPHTSLLGIWAQLKFTSKYEFSKIEKKEIEKIKQLLEKNILDPFTLYQYGHYYSGIVAEIKGFSKSDVIESYRRLPIHHRDEIALSSKELKLMVPKEKIGEIYEDLEKKILSGKLENLKIFIRRYILENYDGRKE